MVSKGYPLIMPREVYFAIAGLVAIEQMSMGKVINMLLREALENRARAQNGGKTVYFPSHKKVTIKMVGK